MFIAKRRAMVRSLRLLIGFFLMAFPIHAALATKDVEGEAPPHANLGGAQVRKSPRFKANGWSAWKAVKGADLGMQALERGRLWVTRPTANLGLTTARRKQFEELKGKPRLVILRGVLAHVEQSDLPPHIRAKAVKVILSAAKSEDAQELAIGNDTASIRSPVGSIDLIEESVIIKEERGKDGLRISTGYDHESGRETVRKTQPIRSKSLKEFDRISAP
jgi:hypothetical protein